MFIRDKVGKVTIEPKMLFVPEFNNIWVRDGNKNKKRALRELAYVYFTADYKSEYNSYGLEKEDYINRDIMNDENYRPDELLINAVEKYTKLQETHSMRYLKSIRDTIESLTKYHMDLRYKPGTSDTSVYDPSIVMKGMAGLEMILEKVEKWEKKVFEEEEDMQIRGGGKAGMFEDEDTATWLDSHRKN